MDQSQSEDRLRQKILELASMYDVPLTEEAVTIRRDQRHTFVEGSYISPVAVLPGYEYQWPFSMAVDAYVIDLPPSLDEPAKP